MTEREMRELITNLEQEREAILEEKESGWSIAAHNLENSIIILRKRWARMEPEMRDFRSEEKDRLGI